MYKIQTLNKIATEGLKRLPLELYEVASEFAKPDGILVRSASLHDMDLPPSLKTIARAGAGVNNIPIDTCSERGVVVFNTTGANANAVKELVIAGLLMSSRRLIDGIAWSKSIADKGTEINGLVEKGKSNFAGPEIQGKTLGVVGLGAIGMQVANAALALGMRVIGFDPFISVDVAWQLSKEVERATSLDALFSQSDYITLHVPLLDETKGFINKSKIDLMKSGVRILNFARGPLVDKAGMLQALDQGKVSCYVNDFPDEAYLKHDKVIALPHLGASTPESEENCARMAVDQVRDYLENGNIRNSVNFPVALMPRNGGYRLTIANKNIPDMVHQITSVLASEQINISDMLNKHRGSVAYNIIDLDQEIAESSIDKLREIKGVLMVRVLTPK
ncbi:MAG: phosphoglycerate dehydrogenase [Cyclobacteriaceae bacterium]